MHRKIIFTAAFLFLFFVFYDYFFLSLQHLHSSVKDVLFQSNRRNKKWHKQIFFFGFLKSVFQLLLQWCAVHVIIEHRYRVVLLAWWAIGCFVLIYWLLCHTYLHVGICLKNFFLFYTVYKLPLFKYSFLVHI